MTKLRRKLLLSVLTLALTFIALGSTTFAWFTLGTEITANKFDGGVYAGQGIDVCFEDGKDETTWNQKTWVKSFNIAEKIDLTGLKFIDLTSADGRVIKNFKGATVASDRVNKDYVELVMYVRTLAPEGKELDAIQLTNVVGVTSDAISWNPDASVLKKGTTINDATPYADDSYEFKAGGDAKGWNALNALRASFTATDGTRNHTEVLEFALANNHGPADATKRATTAGSIAVEYALAKGVDFGNFTDPTFPTTTSITDLNDDGSQATALNKKLNASNVVNYDAYEGYKIYKVTVRVWMEGWDGDCINAILGKQISFGFILSATWKNIGA